MFDDLIELAQLARECERDDWSIGIYEAAMELAPAYGFDTVIFSPFKGTE